jgi:hypothetical protein
MMTAANGMLKILLVVLVIALSAGGLQAQITQTGILAGVVVDESDFPLPYVSITLQIDNIKIQKISTITDEDGRFRIPGLTPGRYEIFVEQAGFQMSQQYTVLIRIGIVDQISIKMLAGDEKAEIGYQELELYDASKSGAAVLFPHQLFPLLPQMKLNDIGLFAGGASPLAGKVSWLGSAVGNNDLLISSGSVSGFYRGNSPLLLPPYAANLEVDSFNKLSVNMSQPGGVITLLPAEAGANLSGYFAADASRLPVASQEDDAESSAAGFNLGFSRSLLKENALWLAVNLAWNQSRLNRQVQTLVPSQQQDFNVSLTSVYKASESIDLSARYIKRKLSDDFHSRPNPLAWTVLETHLEKATDDYSENFDYVSLGQEMLLTDIMSISLNGHWLRSSSLLEPNSGNRTLTPVIDLKNRTIYQGSLTGQWESVESDRVMAKATVDFYLDEMAGAHSILMGAIYEGNNLDRHFGYHSFRRENVLGSFQSRVVSEYFRDKNDIISDIKHSIFMQTFRIFAEDNWTPHPRTSIKLGIHYNGPLAENSHLRVLDWDNISPQIAVSYDLFGGSKSIIRFSAARYYHSAQADQIISNAYVYGRLFRDSSLLANGYSLAGGFRSDWRSNYNRIEHFGYDGSKWSQANMQTKAPYTNEIVLSLDLEPVSNSSLNISYINRRTEQLLSNSAVIFDGDDISRNISQLYSEENAVSYSGDPYTYWMRKGTRGNFANDYYWDNNAALYRSYQGLILRGSYQPSASFFITGSYTYSIAKGNVDSLEGESSGFDPLYSSPSGQHNSDGYLSTDRRHVASFAATLSLPYRSSLGLVARYLSGSPYDKLLYNPALSSLRYDIRADPRGSAYRYDDSFIADLRLEKSFDLSGKNLNLSLDIYNLFNQRTATLVQQIDGADFGLALERELPLTISLGLAFVF